MPIEPVSEGFDTCTGPTGTQYSTDTGYKFKIVHYTEVHHFI